MHFEQTFRLSIACPDSCPRCSVRWDTTAEQMNAADLRRSRLHGALKFKPRVDKSEVLLGVLSEFLTGQTALAQRGGELNFCQNQAPSSRTAAMFHGHAEGTEANLLAVWSCAHSRSCSALVLPRRQETPKQRTGNRRRVRGSWCFKQFSFNLVQRSTRSMTAAMFTAAGSISPCKSSLAALEQVSPRKAHAVHITPRGVPLP